MTEFTFVYDLRHFSEIEVENIKGGRRNASKESIFKVTFRALLNSPRRPRPQLGTSVVFWIFLEIKDFNSKSVMSFSFSASETVSGEVSANFNE